MTEESDNLKSIKEEIHNGGAMAVTQALKVVTAIHLEEELVKFSQVMAKVAETHYEEGLMRSAQEWREVAAGITELGAILIKLKSEFLIYKQIRDVESAILVKLLKQAGPELAGAYAVFLGMSESMKEMKEPADNIRRVVENIQTVLESYDDTTGNASASEADRQTDNLARPESD